MTAPEQDIPAPWLPPVPLPESRETSRLVLRYFTPEDAPSMVAAIDADRASMLPWLPWVRTDNRTVAEGIYSVERFRRDRARTSPPPDDFVIGIFDRATGEVLGGTGLHRIAPAAYEAEIGYWVHPGRRRQGICSEAVAALLSWAFLAKEQGGWGLRRIHIRCAGANTASRRVPAKLGLTQEATLRQERWIPGIGWDDTLVWGVLADEWDTENDRLRRR